MAKKVGRVVVSIILLTAFWFDFLVISDGLGGMTEGKPFLQGVIKTLENGQVTLITFLSSVFIAAFLTYMIASDERKNKN